MAIWKDFNGKNHGELSIKYRLSFQQIYAIIRMMRKNASSPIGKPVVLVVIEEYLPPALTKCGLLDKEAKKLAAEVAGFLCRNFPGISIMVTDALKKSRQSSNLMAAK